MASRKRLATPRRGRRDNGLRLIRRSKMDLQEETAMSMGANQSSHHQRMAHRIFRQPRIPHYPQIRRPSTPTAKILFSIPNKKHLQSSRFADAFLLKSLYHVLIEGYFEYRYYKSFCRFWVA